eukprot:1524156-Heterocapsa_arctica.AAC.1
MEFSAPKVAPLGPPGVCHLGAGAPSPAALAWYVAPCDRPRSSGYRPALTRWERRILQERGGSAPRQIRRG